MNGFDPNLAWIAAGAATLTAVVDGLARRGLGRRVPIGDEVEYLARVGSAEPWRHDPFLRVPLHALLLWAAGRGFGGAGGSERGIDVLLHLVAMATAAALSLAAGLLEGPLAALVAGALWALLPDRWVLSRRLWPDTTLALAVSGVLLCLGRALDGRPSEVLTLGLLLAAAVGLRIDALILIPVVTCCLIVGPGLDLASGVTLIVPAAAVLGGLALFHGSREGRYWPDDTLLFNWRVGRADRLARPLETTMATLGAQWREEACRHAGLGRPNGRNPEAGPRLAERLRRVASLAGQDSFAREKLLAEDAGAYPEALPLVRRVASAALRLSFPMLLAVALASLVPARRWRIELLVSGALLLPAALFTARTRYRYAALPGLVIAAGSCSAALVDSTLPGREVWIIATVGATLLFAAAPRRAERQPDLQADSLSERPVDRP